MSVCRHGYYDCPECGEIDRLRARVAALSAWARKTDIGRKRHAIETVPCPVCGVPAGNPCYGNGPMPVDRTHEARVTDALVALELMEVSNA